MVATQSHVAPASSTSFAIVLILRAVPVAVAGIFSIERAMEYDNPAGSLGAYDARAVDPPPADRVAHRSTRSAHCNREHLVVPRKAPSASRAHVKGVHVRSAGFRHDFLSYRAGRQGDDECRQKGKDEPFAARRQSGGRGSNSVLHIQKPAGLTGGSAEVFPPDPAVASVVGWCGSRSGPGQGGFEISAAPLADLLVLPTPLFPRSLIRKE